MPRSNIVFFTGPNRVFLRRDLDKWIEVFASKYGEYNISRLDGENLEKINIGAELLTPVFLGEKRLIVLEGVPFPSATRETEGKTEGKTETVSVSKTPETTILESLDQIPDTTIVIFVTSEPDKRKALYKKLMETATIKDYPVLEGGELRDYVRRRLPHIDISAASLLIEHTAGDINRIESEIDKLALYKQEDWITETDIRDNVTANIETSIFGLTDAILALDAQKSHTELVKILETHNIHQIFTTILSTLRTFLYMGKLLGYSYDPETVKTALKIHPFAFDKMRKRLVVERRIASLFSEMVRLDRRVKTGEGIGDTDDALRLGLEKAILSLQKR